MHLFDKAQQHAEVWVRDMMGALPTEDPKKALHALRAGLHALRDRLPVNEAAHLAAQFPVLVRGLFFEGWQPKDKPLRIRNPVDFQNLVREKYSPRSDAGAQEILSALFRVLDKHVSRGEITDVMMLLPEELITLVTGEREASLE